jgi:iron complex transport system ATP-binding protein
MFKAQDLSVSLGRWPILENINFSASPGELAVIVGPNGSGKTTLLKALCGDHRYTGSATLNGQEISATPARMAAELRAVLPQSTQLSFPFTVREVVSLGLTGGRPGVSPTEMNHLPEKALQRVDLHGFGGRFYGELSGGEQQRVQLARVLCQIWQPVLDGVPRFLMLDEPVSSLDINHQLQILGLAREFADAGGGVIAILHDLNLAAMFADSITVLKNGKMYRSGTPAEVLEDQTIAHSFDCPLRVGVVPAAEMPFVLPQSHQVGETT